jgi:hypothetical protein
MRKLLILVFLVLTACGGPVDNSSLAKYRITFEDGSVIEASYTSCSTHDNGKVDCYLPGGELLKNPDVTYYDVSHLEKLP